ncbi:MAG: type II toxin-antitoxin system HicB family antitoxin [Thiotrichales bacterium]|jgi:predicted HicB family RNase H-like nuclease|nr:type II toxin-antitoxin system HicB family antitoxin [Thiotrichales bacterium]MBT3612819.1 type II toxin-antitoxin system HicB family antitoxin [Thiotrichales bacterium]MBT3751879.1 type II toxin-antitoxin system HicB family antitoxin [Thiotrichales bacterium]MBT3837245.1 type II toxin-antitoxin system HicB family antitoxin [Thiotrichales bacterium]MBT4152265.1 type II toxin-antitoxin system HicB family antitoxin [Thiotrichales bacterium]
MNTMRYKNYIAKIEYDDIDKIFVGHIVGVKESGGFHGANVEALEEAFHEAVEHYLEVCRKLKTSPKKSYSGRLMLRLTPERHAAIATSAEAHGKSINQWVSDLLGREAYV